MISVSEIDVNVAEVSPVLVIRLLLTKTVPVVSVSKTENQKFGALVIESAYTLITYSVFGNTLVFPI